MVYYASWGIVWEGHEDMRECWFVSKDLGALNPQAPAARRRAGSSCQRNDSAEQVRNNNSRQAASASRG